MSAPSTGRLRVAIAAEASLVLEAVRAALTARDFDVIPLHWSEDGPGLWMGPDEVDVALMISELERWQRLRTVGGMMRAVGAPWVVLTGAPRGSMWGAVIEFGARTILPSDTSLRAVQHALRATVRGESTLSALETAVLRKNWAQLREEREALRGKVATLTPREREVLRLLYAGDSVVGIAETFSVSPTTVRSQVKAILRKLEVNSQLAAVAAFDRSIDYQGADLPMAVLSQAEPG
ncbi:MAG: LuxR C-terminal-related transcriptional regulator [Nocardioides sp.]|uniref:helix-turn-helix transcriptional regulator n=1 Tax=Nocardioides sp. TaxID=35761 RepID=UPI0039E3B1E6